MYKVKNAGRVPQGIVPPRRGFIVPTPGLEPDQWLEGSVQMLGHFGLKEYERCAVVEPVRRPIPHVFRREAVAKLLALYEKHARTLYARMLPELVPPTQTFNKTSKLGWPHFYHPLSKKDVLRADFAGLLNGDLAPYRSGFIVMNVRLQPEPKTKERDFLFVSDEGEVYEQKVGEKERSVRPKAWAARYPSLFSRPMYAARARLVFNLPVTNLFCQVLDTAAHNWLLKHKVFHHDLFTPGAMRAAIGTRIGIDVKHFERFTAEVCRSRARIIGGLYAEIQDLHASLPFLCPSDHWKQTFFLWPDKDAGWVDQFASGNSAVAPAQKEVFFCLMLEFALTRLGIAPSEAVDYVMQGGGRGIYFNNYGDDNEVFGDDALCESYFAFLGEYLHVEREDPTKFLGLVAHGTGYRLAASSYILKTWLNERKPGSNFRKFPFYGWREKRRTYSLLGLPELTESVFPFEDNLLKNLGLPWTEIEKRAAEEERLVTALSPAARTAMILGKDYQLTAEEKLATGLFDGLAPEETAPILSKLLGAEWRH